MHRSVTPMAMRNVNVGWVWSKVGFTMDVSVGSILETTQLDGPSWHLDCISACWMHQMAPSNRWMYRNWTLFVEIVNRIVGGGGHKWTGWVWSNWSEKSRCGGHFLDDVDPRNNCRDLPWRAGVIVECQFTYNDFCFGYVGCVSGVVFVLGGSLWKNSYYSTMWVFHQKNTQPSLVLGQK